MKDRSKRYINNSDKYFFWRVEKNDNYIGPRKPNSCAIKKQTPETS